MVQVRKQLFAQNTIIMYAALLRLFILMCSVLQFDCCQKKTVRPTYKTQLFWGHLVSSQQTGKSTAATWSTILAIKTNINQLLKSSTRWLTYLSEKVQCFLFTKKNKFYQLTLYWRPYCVTNRHHVWYVWFLFIICKSSIKSIHNIYTFNMNVNMRVMKLIVWGHIFIVVFYSIQ